MHDTAWAHVKTIAWLAPEHITAVGWTSHALLVPVFLRIVRVGTTRLHACLRPHCSSSGFARHAIVLPPTCRYHTGWTLTMPGYQDSAARTRCHRRCTAVGIQRQAQIKACWLL